MRSRRNEDESCSKTARFEAIAVRRSATDEKLDGAPLAYECQTISQCPIQVHLQDPAIGGHQQQLIRPWTARHAILQKSHRKEAFFKLYSSTVDTFLFKPNFVYSILQTDTARNKGWVFIPKLGVQG